MLDRVKVACVQAEPAILDLEATLDKVAELAAEAAGGGAALAVFPEAFVPAYPSSRWVRFLAGGADPGGQGTRGERPDVSTGHRRRSAGKARAPEGGTASGALAAFARLARESVEIPGPASDRLAAIARETGLWLALGANERDRGTLYNALLVYSPSGELVLHRRKLVPTNHERLVWGQGSGEGLVAVPTDVGRVGGLICWENLMPLARFALYDSGVEIYLAPTADDSEQWHESIRHIAREARAFVVSPCVFQRASSYPDDIPVADGPDLLGRGGSAILGPDGSYLAGPLWDEEGILYAELDPMRLYEERQRFDASGHYHRPDVFQLKVLARSAGRDRPRSPRPRRA